MSSPETSSWDDDEEAEAYRIFPTTPDGDIDFAELDRRELREYYLEMGLWDEYQEAERAILQDAQQDQPAQQPGSETPPPSQPPEA